MRQLILLPIAMIAALAAAGCSSEPSGAAEGAPPAVKVPIGPIPGPGNGPVMEQDPYTGDPTALMQGRQLFIQYNCYGCHGGHGGGGMGPSLRDQTWIYGSSDAYIFDSIAQGRAKGMPAWGSKLPQGQIWKLVAYIKSMNTSQEPDPPVQR
jgi:cytochrome c oxidase cbb3-type subunit III